MHTPSGIRTQIPASERPKTYALDRAATGIGSSTNWKKFIIIIIIIIITEANSEKEGKWIKEANKHKLEWQERQMDNEKEKEIMRK
jgi:hypothetical protein